MGEKRKLPYVHWCSILSDITSCPQVFLYVSLKNLRVAQFKVIEFTELGAVEDVYPEYPGYDFSFDICGTCPNRMYEAELSFWKDQATSKVTVDFVLNIEGESRDHDDVNFHSHLNNALGG